MSEARPFLSVIVPAHRGTRVLRHSLPSLLASDFPRPEWELIVVDDASGDDTPLVAAEYADRVVPLAGAPRGPAHARNCGALAARGEILVFVDADVCVQPSVLSAFAAAFRADPGLAALFGSYDAEPTVPGLVSRFRNLLHHHVHSSNAGSAETFWAGCGAVRKDAFLQVGMMDAVRYPRPQIEDIELGRRLRRADYRIELRPDIQCTHLKRWTFRNMVVTDFRDRSVPWMRLLLSEGLSDSPATLNLKPAEKVCTALVAVIALSLVAAAALRSAVPLLVAVAAALAVVLINHRFYRLLARAGGYRFAAAAVPLHLVFYFTGGLGAIAGTLWHHAQRSRQPAGTVRAASPRPLTEGGHAEADTAGLAGARLPE